MSQTVAQLIGAVSGSASAPGIAFTGNLNTGIYSPGADQVGISAGGTLRLSISTTAVSSALAINYPLGAVGTPSITFTGDLNTGFWSPAADTVAVSTSGSERARVTSAGELLVGTTTTTANGGKLQVSNGITFPATQVACTDVNTLDDYEEGTWTPQLTGGSGGAYTMGASNAGTYVKIGKLVTLHAFVQWTGGGPYSGLLIVSGFPFVNNSTVRSVNVVGGATSGSIAPNGAYTWLTTSTEIGGAATHAYILQNGVSGYSHFPTVASSGNIVGYSITYQTT